MFSIQFRLSKRAQEDIHALDGGDPNEFLHQVVGIVAVSHGVGGRSSIWIRVLGILSLRISRRFPGDSFLRKRKAVS